MGVDTSDTFLKRCCVFGIVSRGCPGSDEGGDVSDRARDLSADGGVEGTFNEMDELNAGACMFGLDAV